jgi:hypothetical protein
VCLEATRILLKLPVREGNVSVRGMWGIQNRLDDRGLSLRLLDRKLGGPPEFLLFLSGGCFRGRSQERFPAAPGASHTGVAFRILPLRGHLSQRTAPLLQRATRRAGCRYNTDCQSRKRQQQAMQMLRENLPPVGSRRFAGLLHHALRASPDGFGPLASRRGGPDRGAAPAGGRARSGRPAQPSSRLRLAADLISDLVR